MLVERSRNEEIMDASFSVNEDSNSFGVKRRLVYVTVCDHEAGYMEAGSRSSMGVLVSIGYRGKMQPCA